MPNQTVRLLKWSAIFLTLIAVPACAQSTAQPVLPGFLKTTGCPGASVPCFVPYDSANPLPVTGGGGSGGNVNLTGINGVAPSVGNGATDTGTIRATISNDSTGVLTVKQPTASNLNATVVGAGTAGTPSGGVVSVQGVTNGTTLPTTPSPTTGSFTDSSGTVTTSSAQILAGATRKYIMIQNASASATIACNFGSAAALNTAGSVQLTPYQGWTWEGTFVPSQALNCIASASAPLTVKVF